MSAKYALIFPETFEEMLYLKNLICNMIFKSIASGLS